MTVWFVGAGPGDPELITLRGARLLQEAELVVYAGSLVNKAILLHANPAARLIDSAGLALDGLVEMMAEAVAKGQQVVRLHTGDPALFGAIQEQMDALQQLGIKSVMVPGVSSYAAAAAAVGRELTMPEISQTVIITRMGGRTPVPEKENLRALAAHQAAMCIFLSVGMIEQVAAELLSVYPADTPVAVVEKASWPEERVIQATLAEIAQKVNAAGVTKTAMILVGDFLAEEKSRKSRLYAADFSHGFREGIK
ncbi:MAG: precorrin-4 C(11)-methyltransferase [Dethiobacter sp.]|jgi:precorrin-4/cobalt-precorrin-4 C11-methyltransferase|nr:precorrin-4 C(11)-methyltransferase [Dethiobacter sp.]MBS3900363.1 precorrin-4 C(11)-methyltransferase [Dethiobacter sp.]MBS3983180.1 precorrin-4 C(11)-methyltransferase [Dethiobacter sp.]MCL4463425.1 precorrin-4 C(11)-methyltransferase [Bacillota bacterium]